MTTKRNLEAGSIRNQTKALMEHGDKAGEVQDTEVMPDFWHKTYSSCKSIPKYYIAHWLVEGPALLPKDMVDLLDACDAAHGLRKIFSFLTGLSPATWWSPTLHVRKVLSMWLGEQFVNIGGKMRVEHLKEAYDSESGDVDWGALLPFDFDWSLEDAEDMDRDWSIVPLHELPVITKLRHRYFETSEVAATPFKVIHLVSI